MTLPGGFQGEDTSHPRRACNFFCFFSSCSLISTFSWEQKKVSKNHKPNPSKVPTKKSQQKSYNYCYTFLVRKVNMQCRFIFWSLVHPFQGFSHTFKMQHKRLHVQCHLWLRFLPQGWADFEHSLSKKPNRRPSGLGTVFVLYIISLILITYFC